MKLNGLVSPSHLLNDHCLICCWALTLLLSLLNGWTSHGHFQLLLLMESPADFLGYSHFCLVRHPLIFKPLNPLDALIPAPPFSFYSVCQKMSLLTSKYLTPGSLQKLSLSYIFKQDQISGNCFKIIWGWEVCRIETILAIIQ